jgi:hypothetical protein
LPSTQDLGDLRGLVISRERLRRSGRRADCVDSAELQEPDTEERDPRNP